MQEIYLKNKSKKIKFKITEITKPQFFYKKTTINKFNLLKQE